MNNSNRNRFLSIHSVLLFLFGAAFLIAPESMLSLYGTATNSTGLFTARVYGVSNLQFSLLVWSIRDHGGPRIRNRVLLMMFLGNSAAAALAFLAQISGIFNQLGWTNTFLYLLLAVGYGYFLLAPKSDPELD